MTPLRGDYRYGCDTVMIGIGVYGKHTVRGKFSRLSRAPEFTRKVTRLDRVDALSSEYSIVELGWAEAHAAAYREAEGRGWAVIVETA
jgi:hypothetical protein